jgi:hypothetical protein
MKRGDQLYEEYLEESGESTPAFRERIVNQYTEIVRKHLINPHQKIDQMNALNNLQSLQLDDSASSCSSAASSAQNTPNGTRRIKMKRIHVVIVTHGGWIQQFIKFVKEELNYEIACAENKGFPRCTGIYRLEISRIPTPVIDDYEWIGKIVGIHFR